MRASIVTIGDEIISGHVTDTNAAFLAGRLLDVGLAVQRITSVGDDIGAIVGAIEAAAGDSDVVIVTGGLGTTVDDVTKEALARVTGRPLVVDPQVHSELDLRFRGRGRHVPRIVESLARVPEGAGTMENPVGGAPGLRFRYKAAEVYVLPGVPAEMKAIFDIHVSGYLEGMGGRLCIKTRLIRTVGIRESDIEERLAAIMPEADVKIGFLPGDTGVDLRLVARAESPEESDRRLDHMSEAICGVLGGLVYSAAGEDLNRVTGNLLIGKSVTIAVAESLTGGLVGHLLTEVPGISACLERVVVAYSNQAKVRELGVDPETLAVQGAVSGEVARQMAAGIRHAAGTRLGLSTTGIAGPTGASPGKPLGLVFIGLADGESAHVERHVFQGTRGLVKHRAAMYAIDIVRRYLQGMA